MAFNFPLVFFLLVLSDFLRLKILFGATISNTLRTDSRKISSSSSRITCSVSEDDVDESTSENLDEELDDGLDDPLKGEDLDNSVENDEDVDESLDGDVGDVDMASERGNTSER